MECWICGEDHGTEEEGLAFHGEPEVFIQPSLHNMQDVYRIALDWAEDFTGYADDELEAALQRCCEDDEDVQILEDFLNYDLSSLLAGKGFTYVQDADFMAVYKEA